MAGFFVFAKRGLILSFRICSITDQGEVSLSELSAVNACNASVDFAKLSLLVHGSSADEKLANEITISAALAAFDSGNKADSDVRTDTARDDFSLLSLMAAFFPAFAIRYTTQGRRGFPPSDKSSRSAASAKIEDGRAMRLAQS